jgi:deazaflavin-dependent oxidoreductase (nitroreductase family)
MTEFPELRWGRVDGPLRRPAIALAGTTFGSWAIRSLTPLDRRVLTRSNGKYTVLGPIGAPTLLLTTRGRKSGLERTTPLLYARAAPDRLIVVGSNFGQEHHPAWTSNLLADPQVTVTIAGTAVPARATQLHGADADRAFGQLAEEIPVYAAYKQRTDRRIRVFELTPR